MQMQTTTTFAKLSISWRKLPGCLNIELHRLVTIFVLLIKVDHDMPINIRLYIMKAMRVKILKSRVNFIPRSLRFLVFVSVLSRTVFQNIIQLTMHVSQIQPVQLYALVIVEIRFVNIIRLTVVFVLNEFADMKHVLLESAIYISETISVTKSDPLIEFIKVVTKLCFKYPHTERILHLSLFDVFLIHIPSCFQTHILFFCENIIMIVDEVVHVVSSAEHVGGLILVVIVSAHALVYIQTVLSNCTKFKRNTSHTPVISVMRKRISCRTHIDQPSYQSALGLCNHDGLI